MDKKFGLLGRTLRHSYSKQIHATFGDYPYDYIEIEEPEVEAVLKGGEYAGFNVTIPYKELAYSLCDEVSDVAREAGCVNTVIARDGKLYGDNTDVFGFCEMLKAGGISAHGKNVLILGSGATSKTARNALTRLGAAKISIVSRNGEINYENVYDLSDTEIIVNTTPVGMYPKNGECAIDLSKFPKCEGVVDVVYNPAKTKLILDAERLSIPAVSGLYMLAAQAFASSEQFQEKKLSPELIKKAVGSVNRQVLNIVLMGMPGSGKSSIARLLAERLSRPLYDIDLMIAGQGSAPSEIIEKEGEAAFRDIEAEAISVIGRERGLIISTGGGACEYDENYESLSQNGRIYLVERDLSLLDKSDRPLSSDLEALFARRRDKYLRFADVTVDNNGEIESAVSAIMDDLNNI